MSGKRIINFNAGTHLTAAHNITKSTQFYNGIFIENELQVSSLDINTQEAIEQALMEFIVEDTQPFHILKSKIFQRLIELLNSSFVIPCDKRLKALITDSYNLTIENLKLLLVENMTWYSLILDLWIARN